MISSAYGKWLNSRTDTLSDGSSKANFLLSISADGCSTRSFKPKTKDETMTDIDPITAQLNAAREAAGNLATAAPTSTGLVVSSAPQASAVVIPFVQPGAPLSMESAVLNHFAPSRWLKCSKEGEGLKIDNSPLYDELEVSINMAEVQVSKAIKYDSAGSTKYLKSYDGVTTVHGDNFAAKVQEAYRLDPKCKGVYNSADIPMRVLAPLASSKKNDDTIYATPEDVIGHSLSTTNFGEWANFYKRLQGLGAANSTVKVKLSAKRRTGGGFTWGVVTFDLIEVLEETQAA